MSSSRVIKFVVKDAERLADVVLAKDKGGGQLESGLADRLSAVAPEVEFSVDVDEYPGLGSLLGALRGEGQPFGEPAPDIVILSMAGEMSRLASMDTPDDDIASVRSDLVEAIRLIKERVGSHIFVTNVSTLDPSDPVFTYHGVDEQPWTLRGHRLNLMLIGVSHDEGISIIDIDRVIAEAGGDRAVQAAARFSEIGCEAIAAEIARVVEDYGFLDDRPIMEQVGAAAGGRA